MSVRSKGQNLPKRPKHDGIRVRGFFRVNLVEHDVEGNPYIVGDSGWQENTVVVTGKLHYLAMALGSVSGSKYVKRMALGTGAAPASNDTALAGELSDRTGTANTANRISVGAANTAINGVSANVSFVGTWASTNSFVTATHNISNIAVLWTEDAAGTIFAGNTYNSSLLNTNQDVQATYAIQFS